MNSRNILTILALLILGLIFNSCVPSSTTKNLRYSVQQEVKLQNSSVMEIFKSRSDSHYLNETKQFDLLVKNLKVSLQRRIPDDLEGKAYIIDELAQIYAKGIIDFDIALKYNTQAKKLYERIQETGLNQIPLSSYFNSNRDLYYFLFPSTKISSSGDNAFFPHTNITSTFSKDILQIIRQTDLENLGKRIDRRESYLKEKMGILPVDFRTKKSRHRYVKKFYESNYYETIKRFLRNANCYNKFYENFILINLIKDLSSSPNDAEVIQLCKEGIKSRSDKLSSKQIDILNLYYYNLGISYLKTGKNTLGTRYIEYFFEGLKSADKIGLKIAKKQKRVIKKVITEEVEKEREKLLSEAEKITARQKLESVAMSALVGFLSIGATMNFVFNAIPGSIEWSQNQINYIDSSLSSFEDKLNDSMGTRSKKLTEEYKEIISERTLKALRYLNKFEIVELYSLLANAYNKIGNKEDAISIYKEALQLTEKQRITITDEWSRVLFAELQSSIYESIITLLFEESRYEEAFEYTERSKARTFIDILSSEKIEFKTAEETETFNLILQKNNEIYSLLDSNILSLDQILNARGQRSRTIKLSKKFKTNQLEIKSMIEVHTISTMEAKILTKNEFSIIEYFIGKNDLFIFLLDNAKLSVYRQKIDKKEFYNTISRYRKALSNKEEIEIIERLGKQIYNIVFNQVKHKITKKRLYIIPAGWLHYIPFQSLYDGEQYLVEKYAITYSPSTTVIEICFEKPARKLASALIFANANLGDSQYDLPFAEVEGIALSKMINKSRIFVGDKATETNLKTYTERYDILHLATHAEFNSKYPLNSVIYLAKDRENDGQLKAHEIYRVRLFCDMSDNSFDSYHTPYFLS